MRRRLYEDSPAHALSTNIVIDVQPTVPAAAALSAGSLAAFTPPTTASHIIIAADNDPEGQQASDRLHQQTRLLRIPATVILPEHEDFNDDLRKLGRTALARPIHGLSCI